ncbi:hypothetical protein V8C44DRAFT_321561 [Trichoderma aethiopicum]
MRCNCLWRVVGITNCLPMAVGCCWTPRCWSMAADLPGHDPSPHLHARTICTYRMHGGVLQGPGSGAGQAREAIRRAGGSMTCEAPHTVGSRGHQRPMLARSPRFRSVTNGPCVELRFIRAGDKRPVSGR